MTRPRPVDTARAIVESAVLGVRVEAISSIPTDRLLKFFEVKLADGKTLLLTLSPPSSRLLRSEQWLVQSEAALLEWLAEDVAQPRKGGTGYSEEKRTGKRLQKGSSPKRWGQHSASDSLSLRNDRLVNYLPTLVKYSPSSVETGSTFSLFQPTSGDILSAIDEPLAQAEQNAIPFQKGRLMRCITNITSPNGRFGIPVTVLGRPRSPGNTQKTAREPELDFDGADSWRKTFHLLLEGILRDGEDLAVTMSYELVRTTFHKFSHLLDAVKTPRLVVYDADEDDNVLVSRSGRIHDEQAQQGDKTQRLSEMVSKTNDSTADPLDASRVSTDENESTTIQITGLRDWSNSLFGDPLFATIFAHATPEFERGFQHPCESNSKGKETSHGNDEEAYTCIIEDPANAPTRILLYECYHATVAIVRQFYRPDADSSRREIAARRRLMAALAKLETVQGAGKRPRQPSWEGPAKRARGDTFVGGSSRLGLPGL